MVVRYTNSTKRIDMLQDLIQIQPQAQSNYHTRWFEWATPVRNPRAKARHYFQWALIHHARKKPAEAYKYYEKAIIHHRHPLYLRQMALLHHEMGYFRDALKYMRIAFEVEQADYRKKQAEEEKRKKDANNATGTDSFHYITDSTMAMNKYRVQNFSYSGKSNCLIKAVTRSDGAQPR